MAFAQSPDLETSANKALDSLLTEVPELTSKDSVIVSTSMFGVGMNIVDDSDDRTGKVFDLKSGWNYAPYPSRLSLGKYWRSGLGLEGIASYNHYKKGKIVGGSPLPEGKNYWALDARLSYDLRKLIGDNGWFDPYVGVGLGVNTAVGQTRATYNAIFGSRFWFSDRWGIDINTTGKWTMNPDLTDHIQHAAGVVYRFNYEKDLSKKGEKKLAEIEYIQKENERIKDSVFKALKAKEEAYKRAQEEARQKEAERLEQERKAKEAAREKERQDIQNQLEALEPIYYNFDRSFLTQTSRKTLEGLMAIFKAHPGLVLEVGANTDSRGSDAYNMKLSERRLQSVLDYLEDEGIPSDQLVGKAYGETNLVNECDDNTPCSEAKHRLNRRADFKIVSF
ncbi:hypothetical protein GCM10022260_22740 [Gaetbulibacter aestuarii]